MHQAEGLRPHLRSWEDQRGQSRPSVTEQGPRQAGKRERELEPQGKVGPGHRASQPRAISRATHQVRTRPEDQLIEIAWGQAAAQTGISWEDYRKPLKCLVEALPGQPALGSSN